jgi:hypothetical protein
MRRATKLPNIIGYHEVADVDHWLSSDMREKAFGPLGITNIRTYVDPTNPKRVAISADVPDVDALVAYLQSEDGAAAAASDGVALETVVLLVEAKP